MGQSSESIFPPLDVDNEIISEDKEKAEAFNNFFAKASQLDDLGKTAPAVEQPNFDTLNSIQISEVDVMDQLNSININKAYGPDNLPPKLIKEAKGVICKPLTDLFNKSLSCASVPKMWKRANVLPVYKKGDRNLLSNYRPVSLLSINAKIFEKIIFKYVFNFFKDTFLISVWQSGFQSSCSTIMQLIELYHKFCEAVSDGKEIRVVFLDISKAFDRVWHIGLLWKLRKAGICSKLLKWFTSYLQDSFQRVFINGQASGWTKITAGVPQGSVLGPLLFLVFINDIVYVIRHCQIRLFADDTCLFITVDNREEAARLINEDLSHIQTWANEWLVTFSPPKTKTLLISNKSIPANHPELILDGQVIKSECEHMHLGVMFTNNLRWNAHLNHIAMKCTKLLNLMKAFKYDLDRRSLETIYLSFIRPSMEYGDVLFAGTYECDLVKLDRIEVEAMRVVTGATAKSNIQLLYDDVGWIPLTTRRNHHCLFFMYKVLHLQTPYYLKNLLPQRTLLPDGRNLRSDANDLLPVPFARTESFRRSFFPYCIRMWNKVEKDIRDKPTLNTFKSSFKRKKKFYKKLFYLGERWPAIQHARLRIGCSKLNAHLCDNLHVIESSQCVCGYPVEDPYHFFFICPCFNAQRETFLNTLGTVSNNITIQTLFYGDSNNTIHNNEVMFEAVHKYIVETRRFD